MKNRKQFFMDFAESQRFDPLIASNWYTVTPGMLLGRKVF